MTTSLTAERAEPGAVATQWRSLLNKTRGGEGKRQSVVGGEREQRPAALDDMQRNLERRSPQQRAPAVVMADQPAALGDRAGPAAVDSAFLPADDHQSRCLDGGCHGVQPAEQAQQGGVIVQR